MSLWKSNVYGKQISMAAGQVKIAKHNHNDMKRAPHWKGKQVAAI